MVLSTPALPAASWLALLALSVGLLLFSTPAVHSGVAGGKLIAAARVESRV